MPYIVLELQFNNGVTAIVPYGFTDYNEALGKYYSVLSYAVQSSIDKHGAFLLDCVDGGRLRKSEVIDRTAEE